MLGLPELEIVRRDAIVPNLDILFDPDCFVHLLSQSWPEAKDTKADITYVRYKAKKSCLVSYRLTSASGIHELYAKAHPNGIELPSQPIEGRFILEKGAIVVSLFPEDKQLRVISELWNPKKRRGLLSTHLPEIDLSSVDLWVLNYLPERRFVCCMTDAHHRQMVIKAHDEKGMAAASVSNVHSAGRLRIGKKITESEENRFSIYEWLPGNLLSVEILLHDFNPQLLEMVGEALAEFHQQKADVPFLKREEEKETLSSLTEHLAFLYPAMAERLYSVSNEMSRTLHSLPDCSETIHGDFSAKQVLLNGETVGIIDLDRSARGDSALDVGNFIAYLEREAVYGRFERERITTFRDTILRGYQNIAPPPESKRIDFYVTLGLYRLLPDPFRYQEKRWPQNMETILRRIEQLSSRVRGNGAPLQEVRK
jgi:Putative homoserine kinase type II (protein kinase fold)